jgi:formate dehydrogenase major subunit
MIFWGHAPNSQSRGPDLKKGLEKVDLLVVIDPVPTATPIIADRPDGTYLLPAGSTMEIAGSVTNSNRSLQWREKIIDPLFEAKGDYEIAYLLAKKFGYADELFKHIEVKNNEPVAEDILRELNRGMWTVGYTGQSPERLKLHMQHQDKFDPTTLIGTSGPVEGEYYGLPWPCWGTPEMKHPGTPLLYDQSKTIAEGGLPFRARWGVEHEGRNLLAENSYPTGSPIEDGYPEMTIAVLEKLGYGSQLTPKEKIIIVAIADGTYHPRLLQMKDQEAQQLLQQLEEEVPAGPAPDGEKKAAAERVAAKFPNVSPKAHDAIVAYLANAPNGAAEREGSGAKAVSEAAKSETAKTETAKSDAQTGNQDNAETGEQEFSGGEGQGQDQQEMHDANGLREKTLKINWKTDLSGGIQRVAIANGLAPFGNGKARALVWNFPDPIPKHREPLYTPRRDLLPKYETYKDRRDFRLPVLYRSIQERNFADDFPLILTTGRLVEYEGGGDETRANKWLAEFQQEMFAEINTEDAQRLGIGNGKDVWVHTPEGARVRVAAMVTNRVGKGTVFMPFHFAGFWMGEDLTPRYPPGTVPYVVGESANTAATYGYDVVTFMQETKGTLCRLELA